MALFDLYRTSLCDRHWFICHRTLYVFHLHKQTKEHHYGRTGIIKKAMRRAVYNDFSHSFLSICHIFFADSFRMLGWRCFFKLYPLFFLFAAFSRRRKRRKSALRIGNGSCLSSFTIAIVNINNKNVKGSAAIKEAVCNASSPPA